MKLFQWRYSTLLLLGPLWLPTGNVLAAPNVTCIANMNPSILNFGTITPGNANSGKIANITGTVQYTCTNNPGGSAGVMSVCLGVDGGSYEPSVVGQTRFMSIGGGYIFDPRMEFIMTLLDGKQVNALWGTRSFGTGSEYYSGPLPIAENSSISGTARVKIAMTGASRGAREGTYINNFGSGNHTALTVRADNTDSSTADCRTPSTPGTTRFPFILQAAVLPECKITTNPIDINLKGSASETNIEGRSSVGITCTNGGAYYIGLKPSNSNPDGAGIMSGAANNSDRVPYQLRSTTGTAGTIWGNTATPTAVGNGVASIGDGKNQSHTIYVTVPSADFKPDNYSDTVTIRVNY